ncbi:fungal-specific transcription factor domain-containing protein [Chaetomium tenue]|uniref:Fungal-specific transcription factor domain-containing protein n=1 Tax=Chaetomium tenue TaxID=1854479 RepID=A0ACB7P059_9PEZI|nr:fungal-specific transcription factor domain-containing protein [Chaetomium globosum]
MEPPKWRISKACEECRTKKIRCDGDDPCGRCKMRAVDCVYRAKARIRARRSPPAPVQQRRGESELGRPPEEDDHGSDSRALENHSVAATHRASPSMLLQLYYGPSSNFSIVNFIYHQIEGTRPVSGHQKEVQEMGPGLDRFNLRSLYFGDLADNAESWRVTNDTAPMLVDRELADRLLERYLATYWHTMPIWPKDEYRRQLARLYVPSEMSSSENPDTIVVLLSMAMGASMLEEEAVAKFLFQKAKRWSARFDEMVNVQAVQIALLMSQFYAERARPNSAFLVAGTAVRKAVGAGLHKDVTGTAQSCEDTRQRRVTIWSLFFWETWLCFSLGRPSSFPEAEMRVPLPAEQKFLQSLVTLARLMSKCATHIYNQNHKSLAPIWKAANEIRRELLQFAEQQRKDFNFGLVGDPGAGELGVCQTIISTMYHHTLVLVFRPFLVLRAKLRQEDTTSGSNPANNGNGLPTPPPWLDKACEYCLEATRHCLVFLVGACEENMLCREVKYHAFFIESASHVLALDMLGDKVTGRSNLPWIRSGIRALRMMSRPGRTQKSRVHTDDLADNLERITRFVYPDFRASAEIPSPAVDTATDTNNLGASLAQHPLQPPYPDVSMVFGHASPAAMSPSAILSHEDVEQHADLTPPDGGWNFDFATADMEAFLSIDPNLDSYQLPIYP